MNGLDVIDRLNKVKIGLILLLLVNSISLFSQRSNIKFKHLSIQDGLSQSTVNCIFQDEQGFMWFGTQDGLNKYDGFQFINFKNDLNNSSSISNNFVNSIVQDTSGNLWIATNDGLNLFDLQSEKFTSYAAAEFGIRDKIIRCLEMDNTGNLWVSTENHLYKYLAEDDKFDIIELTNNLNKTIQQPAIRDLSFAHNFLWVSTENAGLIRYDISQNTQFQFTKSENAVEGKSLNSNFVTSAVEGSNNLLYITTQNGLNIFNVKNNTFTHKYHAPDDVFSLSSNELSTVFVDHTGDIWIGTEAKGLDKVDPDFGKFHHYDKKANDESSLSSNRVLSIYEDRFGILWIGTEVGLNKFDILKQNFNHYFIDNLSIGGMSSNIIWSIHQDAEERLWLGSNEGLILYDRELETYELFIPNISVGGNKKNTSIYDIYVDQNNVIWLGTDGGLYQFDERNKRFVQYSFGGQQISDRTYHIMQDQQRQLWVSTRNGLYVINSAGRIANHLKSKYDGGALPGNVVRISLQDHNGAYWLGTDDGLVRAETNGTNFEYKIFKNIPRNNQSLSNNTILSLYEDDDDILWVGTFGGGLNQFDASNNTFRSFTQKDELPNDVIYGILGDSKKNLWLSTNHGIARFNTQSTVVNKFDENDGLQSNEFNVGAYFENEQGELFFGGIKGFNSFFPSTIRINDYQPQIIITGLELFNKKVEIGENSVLTSAISELDEVQLSYKDDVFSINFAALHYSLPERNRYAYILEGFDENWVYEENTRKAKYTNLDPGEYIFRVKGTNSDDIWGEETSIRVVIKPPFWKILWVQIAAFLLVAGSVINFYRIRLKNIKAQKAILESQVKERTIQVMGQKEEIEKQKVLLEEEKDKLETLLLNVLPESTVEELKMKGKATARNYRKVSVMFTDFKGFTKISESLEPNKLVEKLDNFFVKFDEIIEKYNVEKIKTIGDAYMCAGGIPIRNKSNPIDVVLAGLEIQRAMDEFNENSNEQPWGLRLGIHTGVIIAGVIGIKRFAYDIWGDTVNVAARTESGGEVGKVNVSEATYEEIRFFFDCQYRGKIHAKNKGDIDMYFVNGIKEELSVDGKGIEPNETFWKYVDTYLFSKVNFTGAEQNILKKLQQKLPETLYYHSPQHAIDVCSAAERLALAENIAGEEIYLIKIAALYHDAGFIKKYVNNEHVGVEMVHADLPKYKFNEEQLEVVEKLILSTISVNQPTNRMEEILRDADLDYLGRDDFHEISDNLKKELMARDMVQSDKHWDELQVKFLETHNYFTETAKKWRNPLKLKHLEEIKIRLKTYKSEPVAMNGSDKKA